MAMNVSIQDMIATRRAILEEVARRVGVTNIFLKDGGELLEEVAAKKPAVFDALRAHLAARQEWFAFHERVEALGKAGNLDRDESDELTALVTEKKNTGKALAAALA